MYVDDWALTTGLSAIDLCPLTARSRVAHAALARARARRRQLLSPDTAVCPRTRCTRLASSRGLRGTVALTLASPSRRRRGPPDFAIAAVVHRSNARLLRPRVPLFPSPRCLLASPTRACRTALACARVDAGKGRQRPRQSRCRRDSSLSCPNLHPVLPEHPYAPLSLLLKPPTVPLSSTPEKPSPEFAEAPPSSLSWAALSTAPLAKPRISRASPSSTATPRPIPEPSPELTELSAAARARAQPTPLRLRPNRGHQQLPRAALVLNDLFPDLLRPRRRRRAATAVADLDSDHPRPRDLAQTNHGEPLSISPYFPGPDPPPFGRRTKECLQPLSRGPSAKFYELVPAAEEIAQESEVNVVHVDPSPEQEYRFEPEGKPRSIT
nr:unnamed protein product [Digitaria exilis]